MSNLFIPNIDGRMEDFTSWTLRSGKKGQVTLELSGESDRAVAHGGNISEAFAIITQVEENHLKDRMGELSDRIEEFRQINPDSDFIDKIQSDLNNVRELSSVPGEDRSEIIGLGQTLITEIEEALDLEVIDRIRKDGGVEKFYGNSGFQDQAIDEKTQPLPELDDYGPYG